MKIRILVTVASQLLEMSSLLLRGNTSTELVREAIALANTRYLSHVSQREVAALHLMSPFALHRLFPSVPSSLMDKWLGW